MDHVDPGEKIMPYFNLNTWTGPEQRLVGVCAVAMSNPYGVAIHHRSRILLGSALSITLLDLIHCLYEQWHLLQSGNRTSERGFSPLVLLYWK